MVKKGKQIYFKNAKLPLYYKWEFLRRNKRYIKDYENFLVTYKNIFYKYPTVAEVDSYIESQFKHFLTKYEIKFPVDPSISAIELYKNLKKPINEVRQDDWKQMRKDMSIFKRKISKQSAALQQKMKRYISCVALPPERSFPYYLNGKYKAVFLIDLPKCFVHSNSSVTNFTVESEISLKIQKIVMNINSHASLAKILNDITQMIEAWHSLLKRDSPNNRLRFWEYDRYLEVYDLLNNGYSERKIVKKYYSGYSKNDPYYATRKVRRDYERGKKLVEGGFRQID